MSDALCTKCNQPLTHKYSCCADDDPYCECDKIFHCKTCDLRFIKNCPAHKGQGMEGCIEIFYKEDES